MLAICIEICPYPSTSSRSASWVGFSWQSPPPLHDSIQNTRITDGLCNIYAYWQPSSLQGHECSGQQTPPYKLGLGLGLGLGIGSARRSHSYHSGVKSSIFITKSQGFFSVGMQGACKKHGRRMCVSMMTSYAAA